MDPKTELMLGAFKTGLRIKKEAIDDELVCQPETYFEVAEASAFANSRAVKAKEDLKGVEAARARVHAADLAAAGERITDKAISDLVATDPKRRRAFEAFLVAQEEAARWEALKESYYQRSYALKDLAHLMISGVTAERSVSGSSADAGRALYEQNRAKLAEHRKKKVKGHG